MKCFLHLLTATLLTVHCYCQSTEDSIKLVINNLFEGMKESDSVKIKNCFSDSMILQTITYNEEGDLVVKTESTENFVELICSLPFGAADERARIQTINIDGPLAVVWATYNFFYKGQFSHCGVDSFQLIRFKGSWKIHYLIDTNRKTNCN